MLIIIITEELNAHIYDQGYKDINNVFVESRTHKCKNAFLKLHVRDTYYH